MKKSRFTESQIVNILKEAEGGIPVEDLSRQHGFSKATFYNWKAKYGGMTVSEVKRSDPFITTLTYDQAGWVQEIHVGPGYGKLKL